MKKLLLAPIVIAGVLSLTSCASITERTSQHVAVKTSPVEGAACPLQNNKGKWVCNQTPGIVTVHQSAGAMNVSCKKAGYGTATRSFRSTTKGMVAGNLLFGGIIGGGVDVADGAAFHYPSTMRVRFNSKS